MSKKKKVANLKKEKTTEISVDVPVENVGNSQGKKVNLLLDVNEKPKALQWIILSLQHVFAMFGATVLVPILVNQAIVAQGGTEALSIAVALITSGIGIMVIGIIYIIVSFIIRLIGKRWIDKLLPPIVIGPMIMIIGLGLASSAVNSIGIGSGTENIEFKNVLVAIITFLTTTIIMVKAKGFLKVIPFIVGIGVGYLSAVVLGMVDFTAVGEAGWIQAPNFQLPFISYTPNLIIALSMAPIALVTMAEHIGDHTALSTIIGKNLLKEPGLENTLLGDGLATFVAGLLGGPANTTYGENTSVVGMTKVASVWVIGLAAIIAIVFGFLGKFTALIQTIPNPVLGGISLLLYGFIAVNGLKILIQNQIDFGKNKNIIIASCMLVLGLGGAVINFKTSGDMIVPLSGMSLAALAGILLNLLLPEK